MKKGLYKVIILLSLIISNKANIIDAQLYEIDASNVKLTPVENLFRMGNPGPAGKEIKVTTQYLTIGGQPVLLTMGEFHFSRMKPELWEETILKMKACGIDVIATYLFWNHHEEIEGQFEWDNSNNIRAFIELCKKYNMYAFPRIGPWSHGEARLGGTPDWILRKEFIVPRNFDPVYQSFVERYFKEMAKQFEGLYYKDGGPIIGIQLENEYNRQKEGEPYIMWLKNLVQKLGMDVPLYTCTAWGGSLPPYEVLGVSGGYGEEFWESHIERNIHYFNIPYSAERRTAANKQQRENPDPNSYPQTGDYQGNAMAAMPQMDCEIGPGMQNSYHRRFAIDPLFSLVMPFCKVATGSNVLGYYIFTGTTQLHGQLHITGEDVNSGYPNQMPYKSYDFQTAIRESGEISEGYKHMKRLHYFLNEFGPLLSPLVPNSDNSTKYIMDSDLNPHGQNINNANPQHYKVRSDNNSGFLFGINYTRFTPKTEEKTRFKVKFQNEIIEFPKKEITIPDGSMFIWPLNFDMDGCKIKYATAQLLNSISDYYFFYQNGIMNVEFEFDNSNISKVTCNGKVDVTNGVTMVSGLQPGKECVISIVMKNGVVKNIIVLTEKEATNTWIFQRNGKKELFITDANMYCDDKDVYIFTDKSIMNGFHFEGQDADNLQKALFKAFSVNVPSRVLNIKIEPHSILADAQWLETSNFEKIEKDQVLNSRSFFKEFSLENPSRIKKATLFIYSEANCFIQLNEINVNQTIEAGKLNAIDLTGYVKKGDNMIVLNFPFTAGIKRMAARLSIVYENLDKVEMYTDTSWITSDVYGYPSFLNRNFKRPVAPVITSTPDYANNIKYDAFSEWNLIIPNDVIDGLNNIYFHIQYAGDRAELYNGYMLVADDFNNNTYWSIGLNRLEKTPAGQTLRVVIYPLSRQTKIFFDNPPKDTEYDVATIKNFEVIPEYKVKLN
jgi:Glycosyl hydrolases family 35